MPKGFRTLSIFTFQSGYIQMQCQIYKVREFIQIYIPIWLYSNRVVLSTVFGADTFTFQSGYIQIISKFPLYVNTYIIYIPIWLYSN